MRKTPPRPSHILGVLIIYAWLVLSLSRSAPLVGSGVEPGNSPRSRAMRPAVRLAKAALHPPRGVGVSRGQAVCGREGGRVFGGGRPVARHVVCPFSISDAPFELCDPADSSFRKGRKTLPEGRAEVFRLKTYFGIEGGQFVPGFGLGRRKEFLDFWW